MPYASYQPFGVTRSGVPAALYHLTDGKGLEAFKTNRKTAASPQL